MVAAQLESARSAEKARRKLELDLAAYQGKELYESTEPAADGLLLLAYPLHPAGKPEQLRDAHLARITMPVLCFNGTRDPLCRRDLMEAVAVGSNFEMHWLERADHSFHVPKSSGRTDADVLTEVGETTAVWVARIERSVARSTGP